MDDSEICYAMRTHLMAKCDLQELQTVESKQDILRLLPEDFFEDLKNYLFEHRMLELDTWDVVQEIKRFCEEQDKDEYSDSCETESCGRQSRCSSRSSETESD